MPRTQHLSLAEATDEQIADALEGKMPEAEAQPEPTPDETKPPKIFGPAEDVEQVARAILSQSYPKVKGCKFVYLYVSESFKVDGEDCLMKATKVQGVNAYMAQFLSENVEAPADPFFLILVNKPMWTAMDLDQKLAVLDNTLWQCHIRETGALYIRKPEIKTSVEVVHRRGLYTNKLKDMGQVAKKHILQPDLLETA